MNLLKSIDFHGLLAYAWNIILKATLNLE